MRTDEVVLDASALLAVLRREPGAESVREKLSAAVICAVNLSEVIAVLVRRGVPAAQIREALEPLELDVRPFEVDDAYLAGELAPGTRRAGLSFGDRACLALAKRLGRSALTADKSWSGVKVGVDIRLVR